MRLLKYILIQLKLIERHYILVVLPQTIELNLKVLEKNEFIIVYIWILSMILYLKM